MRFHRTLQILILAAVQAAGAMPVADLKTNCQRGSQSGNFRDIIHQVAVYDEDDRKPLSKSAVKLTPEEAEQAMRCSGYIFCPNAEGGRPKTFSAGAVCPPGSRDANGNCPADRLGTVAHGFVNHANLTLNDNLARCEFRNYRGHRSALEIRDIKTINATEVMDVRTSSDNRQPRTLEDKTVVRLKKPIPGCNPYDIAQAEDAPRRSSDIVALTFKQAGMSMSQSDGTEPLVYPCSVTRVFKSRQGGVGAFYGNCDLTRGGSGGFAMVRNSKNQLVVAGIFSGANNAAKDGDSYDEAASNYTAISATSADFVLMAQNPSQRPTIQAGQNNSPATPRPTSD